MAKIHRGIQKSNMMAGVWSYNMCKSVMPALCNASPKTKLERWVKGHIFPISFLQLHSIFFSIAIIFLFRPVKRISWKSIPNKFMEPQVPQEWPHHVPVTKKSVVAEMAEVVEVPKRDHARSINVSKTFFILKIFLNFWDLDFLKKIAELIG